MENTLNALDSEPFINEVSQVIRKGINDLLGKFSERYDMLEDTHYKIMNLPSVQHQLNGNSSTSIHMNNCSSNMNDVTNHISNLMLEELLPNNKKLQEKIDSFDNKINEYNELVDKTSGKMDQATTSNIQKQNSHQLHKKMEYKTAFVGISAMALAIGCFHYMKK